MVDVWGVCCCCCCWPKRGFEWRVCANEQNSPVVVCVQQQKGSSGLHSATEWDRWVVLGDAGRLSKGAERAGLALFGDGRCTNQCSPRSRTVVVVPTGSRSCKPLHAPAFALLHPAT